MYKHIRQLLFHLFVLSLVASALTAFSLPSVAMADPAPLYVTGRDVNMRTEPSVNGTVIGSWLLGQAVMLQGYEGDFAAVTLPVHNEVLYIARQYLGSHAEAEAKYGPATKYMVTLDNSYRCLNDYFMLWNDDTATFIPSEITSSEKRQHEATVYARYEGLPLFTEAVSESNLDTTAKKDFLQLADYLDQLYYALLQMQEHKKDGQWEPYYRQYEKTLEEFIPLYNRLGDLYR